MRPLLAPKFIAVSADPFSSASIGSTKTLIGIKTMPILREPLAERQTFKLKTALKPPNF
jgi:hypothetical protein